MATARHRYVDTDLGTDDISHGDSAGTGAYATLAYCESQEYVDLVSADVYLVIHHTGATADVPVDFWNNAEYTDATHYIEVIGDFAGTSYDVTKSRVEGGPDDFIFNLDRCRYFKLRNFQVKLDVTTGVGSNCAIYANSTSGYSVNILVDSCFVWVVGEADAITNYGIGGGNTTDTTWNVHNTIVWNSGERESDTRGIQHGVLSSSIYNCTISGFYGGVICGTGGTMNLKNSAIFNNTDDLISGTGITFTKDYNALDDGDTQTHNIAENGGDTFWTNDFADAANGDFTLLSGSPLVGSALVNPSSGLFIDDILGNERGDLWDVGAHEYSFLPYSVTNEAEREMLTRIVCKHIIGDGDTLKLRLFNNNKYPEEGDTFLSFTESDGAGYALKTLKGDSWTFVTGDTTYASYAQQTFTFTGGDSIYGFYITTKNSDGDTILFLAKRFASAPYTIPITGGSILITPRISLD